MNQIALIFFLNFPESILIGRNIVISYLFHGHIFFSGKSNTVTGLAKAIKDHFRKHPFVIVNVKGRAKGTSVHELVSKLEVMHDEICPLFSFLIELFFFVLTHKYSLNPEIVNFVFSYCSCSTQQVQF